MRLKSSLGLTGLSRIYCFLAAFLNLKSSGKGSGQATSLDGDFDCPVVVGGFEHVVDGFDELVFFLSELSHLY